MGSFQNLFLRKAVTDPGVINQRKESEVYSVFHTNNSMARYNTFCQIILKQHTNITTHGCKTEKKSVTSTLGYVVTSVSQPHSCSCRRRYAHKIISATFVFCSRSPMLLPEIYVCTKNSSKQRRDLPFLSSSPLNLPLSLDQLSYHVTHPILHTSLSAGRTAARWACPVSVTTTIPTHALAMIRT